MGKQNKQGISWTDETWNPMIGCSKVSPGCDNCWAAKAAWLHYHHAWDGNIRLFPERLQQPLHWRKPRKIAVCLMGDLFHPEVSVTDQEKIFRTIFSANQHVFQILTKRAEIMAWQMQIIMNRIYGYQEHRMPDNVWLGVSCENQAAADERIPLLLQTPAAVRFVSCEPLLGPTRLDDLTMLTEDGNRPRVGMNCLTGYLSGMDEFRPEKIDWVIVGGESGPGARPCHPDWVRTIVQQCKSAGVAVHVKQIHLNGKLSKNMDEWPEYLRVREFPEVHIES